MSGGRPFRASLLLLGAASFAGVARANLGTMMDALTPVSQGSGAAEADRQSSRPTTGPHKIHRHSDGLFYTKARVNRKAMRFLIDTGASVVVLTEPDARAIGIVLEDEDFSQAIVTAGGKASMAWVTIDRIELAGHEVRSLRASVVRNGAGVSLLGQNMLSRLDSLTIRNDGMTLQ